MIFPLSNQTEEILASAAFTEFELI